MDLALDINSEGQGKSLDFGFNIIDAEQSIDRFGAQYQDGYGISCEFAAHFALVQCKLTRITVDMPAADRLRFGIESKHSCPRTSTQCFMTAITSALHDMKALCTPTLLSHL